MKAERLQQIEQLFHAALEREESRRGEFLREACGVDEALRHEVETLLACATNAENVFESTATNSPIFAGDDAPFQALPANIGRYRILRLLGEGGMGAVYEAEQEHPRRTVALKVIKPGLTNPEHCGASSRNRRRWAGCSTPALRRSMKQVLRMPASGPQPYFAMELIRGQVAARVCGSASTEHAATAGAHGEDLRSRTPCASARYHSPRSQTGQHFGR